MHQWLPSLAFVLICAAPAAALDLPERKAGLWELKMAFEGGNMPAQTAEHCIDAETDKLMSATGGSMVQDMCSKPDVKKTGDTFVVDSTCKIGPYASSSHAVISGDFNSAYTVKVVSKQEGPAIPGMPAERTMTIDAKWVGACKADQKPGDMIIAGRNSTSATCRTCRRYRAGPQARPRPRRRNSRDHRSPFAAYLRGFALHQGGG
jgi:hypothetical protein